MLEKLYPKFGAESQLYKPVWLYVLVMKLIGGDKGSSVGGLEKELIIRSKDDLFR